MLNRCNMLISSLQEYNIDLVTKSLDVLPIKKISIFTIIFLNCIFAVPSYAAFTVELKPQRSTELYVQEEQTNGLESISVYIKDEEIDSVKKAIKNERMRDSRLGTPNNNPGMLVLSVGEVSASGTIFYYTEEQSKFRQLRYESKMDKNGIPQWAAKVFVKHYSGGHFGSLEKTSSVTSDISSEVLVVKIPLSERGTINTLIKFKELESSGSGKPEKDLKDLFHTALGVQPLFNENQKPDTLLGWLYQSLLEHHPSLASGVNRGYNTSCLPAGRLKRDRLKNIGKYLNLARQMININVAIIADPLALKKGLLRFFNEVGSNAFDLYLANFFDLTVMSIIDCQMKRDIFFGEDHEINNMVLRSQYHRLADEMLRSRYGKDAPRFFSAFHIVTSPFVGGGFVDLPEWIRKAAERESLPEYFAYAVAMKFFFVNPPKIELSCSIQNDELNGAQSARLDTIDVCGVIRSINLVLFEYNRGVIRRLANRRTISWFDPLGKGKEITNSLDFDVRMVLMEQSLVKNQIQKLDKKDSESVNSMLTELASSTLRLEPEQNANHNQWISCKVGDLIYGTLGNNKTQFRSFNESSDEYIFDPTFENYWWRVAIGIAYVLVLREDNPRATTCGVSDGLSNKFLGTLNKVLEEAPKKNLKEKEQEVVRKVINTQGLSDGEIQRQTDLVDRALKNLKGSKDIKWQGCDTSNLIVTRRRLESDVSWEEILTTLTKDYHAMTLSEVFESAGGTNGDTLLVSLGRDDSTREFTCDAIEARKIKTWCLLNGEVDCYAAETGVFAGSNDEIVAFIDFASADAAKLRSELPAIWPFLVEAIEEGKTDPYLIARRSIDLRSEWEREVAQARLLESTGIDVLKDLGLAGIDYGARVAEAVGISNLEESDSDWRELERAFEPSERRKRIAKSREWRKKMKSQLSELQRAHPLPYDSPYLPQRRATRFASSTSRLGNEREKPGVVFYLERTKEHAPDGRPIHRAIGTYKVPSEARGREPKNSFLIGLEVVNVVVEPDGTLLALNDDGRNNIRINELAARTLLSSFGLSAIFSEATVRYKLTDDFKSLTMHVTPTLKGIKLNEFELVLLENGVKQQNISQKLISGLQASVQGATEDKIRDLLQPINFNINLGKMKIDFMPCKQNKNLILLEGLNPIIDGAPPPLRLIIRPAFCLEVGYGSGTVTVTARPEIVLDSNGLHIKKTVFDEGIRNLEKVIYDYVKNTVCKNRGEDNDEKKCWIDKHEVTIVISSGTKAVDAQPESHGSHGLRVGVNAGVKIPVGEQQCVLPIRFDVAFADMGEIGESLRAKIAELKEKKNELIDRSLQCATDIFLDKAFTDLVSWFDKRSNGINIIGTRFNVDCREMEDVKKCAEFEEGGRIAKFDVWIEFTGRHFNGVTGTCEDIQEIRYEIANLVIELDEGRKINFSVRELNEKGKKELALAALSQACQLAANAPLLGELFNRVQFKNPTVGENEGHLYANADVTIRDVLYFGDVYLGRMPLLDLGDPSVLSGVMINLIVREFGKVIEGENSIPYVGTFEIEENAVSFIADDKEQNKFAIDGKLEITGKLSIREIAKVGMTLSLKLPSLDQPKFEVDSESVTSALNSIIGVLKQRIPFGGDKFNLEIIRFGEVAPGTKNYGLILDAGVEFPNLFTVEVDGLSVGTEGVRIGGMISGELEKSISLGGIAELNKIGFTYFPGLVNPDHRGLVINADIVPVSSLIEKIAKIEAQLDLTDIDELRLVLKGDLIVLDATSLLSAYGELDIDDVRFLLDATTPKWLENVVAARGAVWIGIDPDQRSDSPTFGLENEFSLLGVDLGQVTARVDMAEEDEEGRIQFESGINLLLGKAELTFESKPDFTHRVFLGKAEVGLFGWSFIEAEVKANSKTASASLEVFRVPLSVSAPSIDRIDKRMVYQALRGQFGMSLADMAKLDPEEGAGRSIRKVTREPDGSMKATEVTSHSTPHDQPKEDGEVGETRSGGANVDGEVGETRSGGANVDGEVGETRSGGANVDGEVGETRSGGANVDGDWVALRTRVGPWTFEQRCDEQTARAWLNVRDNAETLGSSGGLPVRAVLACWRNGITAIADIFYSREKDKLAMRIQCPNADEVPQIIKQDEKFEAVCGEKAPDFLQYGIGDAPWFKPNDTNLVDPESAYRVFEIGRAVAFGRDSISPTIVEIGKRYKAMLYADTHGLTVLMADKNFATIFGVGQIDDKQMQERLINEAESARAGEDSWTQTLLGPWFEDIANVKGNKHPNHTRPRTIKVIGDVLAWTPDGSTEPLAISKDVLWSWRDLTDENAVETRKVSLETYPPTLQDNREKLIEDLSRNLPKVEHSNETQVILTRNKDGYELEFLALLPMQSDGNARISFVPLEADGRIRNLCGKVSAFEEQIVNAHQENGGDSAEFDLRKWLRYPERTLRNSNFAPDPLNVITSIENECR